MKISLLVQGAPYSSYACEQALSFAKAVVRKQITLFRVFFYKDAVSIANRNFELPSDEWNIQKAWLDFAKSNQVELMICIGAAQRRGVGPSIVQSDENEGFKIVGLGQFIEATIESDRVVTFN